MSDVASFVSYPHHSGMDLLKASWLQFMGTKHLWNFDPWDFFTLLDMLGVVGL